MISLFGFMVDREDENTKIDTHAYIKWYGWEVDDSYWVNWTLCGSWRRNDLNFTTAVPHGWDKDNNH